MENLNKYRIGTDVPLAVTLNDSDVEVNWPDVEIKRVAMYSEAQEAFAGNCSYQPDDVDGRILRVKYPAAAQLYIGVCKLIVEIVRNGSTQTYDAQAIELVDSIDEILGGQGDVVLGLQVTSLPSAIISMVLGQSMDYQFDNAPSAKSVAKTDKVLVQGGDGNVKAATVEQLTGGAGGQDNLIPITWSALVNLRNAKGLTAGAFYRILDYTCTTTQLDTSSAGHVFDIIVRADSADTLNEVASAAPHAGDRTGYFDNCKLEAWELKYCLDNDTSRFAWADDEDGKGVIYYMKDEFFNECPYDFKNILFKRYYVTAEKDFNGYYVGWVASDNFPYNVNVADMDDWQWRYTFSLVNEDGDFVDYTVQALQYNNDETAFYASKGAAKYNKIEPAQMVVISDDEEFGNSGKQALNNIVFVYEVALPAYHAFEGNTIGENCVCMTFMNATCSNMIGADNRNILAECYFDSNRIVGGCSELTFGRSVECSEFACITVSYVDMTTGARMSSCSGMNVGGSHQSIFLECSNTICYEPYIDAAGVEDAKITKPSSDRYLNYFARKNKSGELKVFNIADLV